MLRLERSEGTPEPLGALVGLGVAMICPQPGVKLAVFLSRQLRLRQAFAPPMFGIDASVLCP